MHLRKHCPGNKQDETHKDVGERNLMSLYEAPTNSGLHELRQVHCLCWGKNCTMDSIRLAQKVHLHKDRLHQIPTTPASSWAHVCNLLSESVGSLLLCVTCGAIRLWIVQGRHLLRCGWSASACSRRARGRILSDEGRGSGAEHSRKPRQLSSAAFNGLC